MQKVASGSVVDQCLYSKGRDSVELKMIMDESRVREIGVSIPLASLNLE